jgi:hypothetical protein
MSARASEGRSSVWPDKACIDGMIVETKRKGAPLGRRPLSHAGESQRGEGVLSLLWFKNGGRRRRRSGRE